MAGLNAGEVYVGRVENVFEALENKYRDFGRIFLLRQVQEFV